MRFGGAFLLLMGFLFLFPSGYANAVSPIAHWKFDEGTGSAPTDSSGNNITGAFNGTTPPTWSTDVPSVAFSNPYSLSFVSDGDGVLFNWPAGLNMNATDARSFSFWFKPTAAGESSGNFSRIVSWTGDQFEIAGSDADYTNHKLSFYDGNSWRSTNYSMSLNTWYQVTFTFDGGSEYLYIGGVLQFSASTTNNALSGVIGIGTRVNNTPHNEGINGLIDDVRIYSTALTGTQISNLNSGSNNPDVPPDTTGPSISSIASSTSSTGATITWTTDEAASSKVVYSTNSTYASTTSETDTSTRVTSHSKSISGLVGCTSYNFKVVSADEANNYATSSASNFTTSGCPGGASPSSATTTTITVSGAATSSITDSGRTLVVATPANFTATSSSVVIQIKGLSASTVLGSIGKPSSSLSSAASVVFDVTALIDNSTVLNSFDTAVTISYTYTDADISGLNESSLKMYHYHDSQWLELDSCTVNASTNTITCTAPSFSTFAIFGTSASSSSSSNSGTSGGTALPWCSGPNSPGWNVSLTDGGCGDVRKDIGMSQNKNANCTYYRFTRQLKKGDRGEDVRALQRFLNCAQFTVAVSGAGSPGKETPNLSDKTLKALAAFQKAYSTEILAPINAKTPTLIFGQYSQKKAYSLMKDPS